MLSEAKSTLKDKSRQTYVIRRKVREHLFCFSFQWKTRYDVCGWNVDGIMLFIPFGKQRFRCTVVRSTIQYLLSRQGKAKVKNLKAHVVRRNHCKMQNHVSSLCTYVIKNNSEIEQRSTSFLFNRIIF